MTAKKVTAGIVFCFIFFQSFGQYATKNFNGFFNFLMMKPKTKYI